MTRPSESTRDPIQYALDGMTGYNADLYREDLITEGTAWIVQEEWVNVWTQGDNAFATREDAEAYVEEVQHDNGHVVELTRQDVATALERAFGSDE